MIMFSVSAFADMKVIEKPAIGEGESPTYVITRTKTLKKRDGTAVDVVDVDNTEEFDEAQLLKKKANLVNRLNRINSVLSEIENIKAAK